MRQILYVITFLLLMQLEAMATSQEHDILIWNGDTLELNKSPLEQLPEVCEKIVEKENSISSSCWNGFVAEWTIIDSTLFLQNIFSYATGEKINHRLEKILGTQFENGRLKVEWFSSSFYGQYGNYIDYIFFNVYEKVRLFSFDSGQLVQVIEYNAQNTKYSIDKNIVEEFVYRNFNWELFDINVKFNEQVSVFIYANFNGELKTIEVEKSAGKIIDNEVIRVITLIPNWGTYYKDGQIFEFYSSYDFRFDNKQMKKYAR